MLPILLPEESDIGPDNLEKHGNPQRPEDLQQHACLQLVSSVTPLNQWTMHGAEGSVQVNIKSNFQVNVAEAMLVSLKEGMGIGVLPTYSAVDALRAGTIMRILPQYRLQQMGVYALYSSRQYIDAKISTWVDWVHQSVSKAMQEDHLALERITLQPPEAR